MGNSFRENRGERIMEEFISKNKVYEAINSLMSDIEDTFDGEYSDDFERAWDTALSLAIDRVEDIDAADVRPERHGMCINGEECSVCGAKFSCDETDYFCYCPCCGTMMDEGE